MQSKSKPAGSIKTLWELRTYDVWGNARDGYEVNDSRSAGSVVLHIPQTRYNVGTPFEFLGAYPTDKQIRSVFGVRCKLTLNGDNMTIYVDRTRDGYPLGEMHCSSHDSLSPVRKKPGYWNGDVFIEALDVHGEIVLRMHP